MTFYKIAIRKKRETIFIFLIREKEGKDLWLLN